VTGGRRVGGGIALEGDLAVSRRLHDCPQKHLDADVPEALETAGGDPALDQEVAIAACHQRPAVFGGDAHAAAAPSAADPRGCLEGDVAAAARLDHRAVVDLDAGGGPASPRSVQADVAPARVQRGAVDVHAYLDNRHHRAGPGQRQVAAVRVHGVAG